MKIAKEVEKESAGYGNRKLADIYIRMKWWDKLFVLLKQNVSHSIIENYEEYLKKDFAEELVSLYKDEVRNYLEYNINRKAYKNACRYLRRMLKLGGKETVDMLVKEFRRIYPKRKALMQELDQV